MSIAASGMVSLLCFPFRFYLEQWTSIATSARTLKIKCNICAKRQDEIENQLERRDPSIAELLDCSCYTRSCRNVERIRGGIGEFQVCDENALVPIP